MSKTIKVCFLLCAFSLITAPVVMAQTAETTDADTAPLPELISEVVDETEISEEVIEDEAVSPEDLGIKEPTLLPDSKFYFLKSWRRGLKSLITRDPVKKAELKLKYASEKLLEARKLADKKKRPEILIKATENFEQEMEKVKTAVDKMKDTASSNAKVGKFLDKYLQKEFLHQKILDQMEGKVPEGVLGKIQEVKTRQLTNFGLVMEKLEDKEQIKSRIENNLKTMKGSAFKNVKEMEILKRFEEKAPEAIKEKIMEARELRLEDFKGKMEQMKPEVRERFDGYMEKVKGEGERKMEILEDIKGKIQLRPDIQEKLEQAQSKVMNRARVQTEKQGVRCPLNMINPRSCNGKMIVERDGNNCPIPRCIEVTNVNEPTPDVIPPGVTGENYLRRCPTLFDPVCGVNGRTYSNTCKIRIAGVEIKHKGACPGTNPPEPVLPVIPAIPDPDGEGGYIIPLKADNLGGGNIIERRKPEPNTTGPVPTTKPTPTPQTKPEPNPTLPPIEATE
ncbi:MAG: hypothetical protein HQ539_02145 [Parcubacteria group bacterium]|nr:hypothetical protein [Parcubacteria group bacterium]